jgi:pimeloyl-ACP methyl ester carboxylesterase
MATDSQDEQTKRSGLRASRPPSGDALAHTTPPKRRKTLWRRTRRVLLVFALLILGLSGTGFLYQTIASAVDASSYPPPGKLIDVGGYRLHLYCTGTARSGSPTVILEAGNGGTALYWSKVQPDVATFTRVCSYDRAGYGWSDDGPKPRTSEQIVRELHTLLVKAGIPGPYLLVGHSFGGLTIRLYASTYPGEAVGLILVDAMHEDQFVRQPQMQQNYWLSMQLCRFGLLRLLGGSNQGISAYFPSAVQAQVKAQVYQTRFCQAAYDEATAFDESFTQVRTTRSHHTLEHLPVVILTHGIPEEGNQGYAGWQALQHDLVGLSAKSTQIVATRSGHDIMLQQPELVIAAIKQRLTEQG